MKLFFLRLTNGKCHLVWAESYQEARTLVYADLEGRLGGAWRTAEPLEVLGIIEVMPKDREAAINCSDGSIN